MKYAAAYVAYSIYISPNQYSCTEMRSSQAVETRRFSSLANLSHKNSAGWKLKKRAAAVRTYTVFNSGRVSAYAEFQ